MNDLKQRLKEKKGFTLAELLVVVAIIAVLVAIAIPTFSGALTKAQKATDDANIRAAYAEHQVYTIDSELSSDATVSGNVITFADNSTYTLKTYTTVVTNDGVWHGTNGTTP